MSPDMVLIDTSVWLLVLGRKLHIPQAREKVEQLVNENRAAVTPMVSLEVLGGAKSKTEFNDLRSQLDSLHQLPIDNKEWHRAARLAFELYRQGKSISCIDILIAATALQAGASLLHADHHFDQIAEVTGQAVDSLVSLVQKKL